MKNGLTYPQDEGREEGLVAALEDLGGFVVSCEWKPVPELHEALLKTLLDTIGVTIAGSQTEEVRSLIAAWNTGSGRARIFGTNLRATSETAAYLNGFSAVTLELDEGNKCARGHPAAHTFPAALAVAQERGASGPELAAALVAGYETASRFGRATRLSPGVHPHGNWGTAGSAAAVARLLRLDARATATALEAACGTVLATPFEAALAGSAARNGWVGISNLSGMAAARMAAAGLVGTYGLPRMTLGRMIGDLDPGKLTTDLGERFDLSNGYFKRHASCSYTHPPADATLELLWANSSLVPAQIVGVTVETHSLAATQNGVPDPPGGHVLHSLYRSGCSCDRRLRAGGLQRAAPQGPRGSAARLGDPRRGG